MKKILLVLLPSLLVMLTGCSTAMADMEETHDLFKDNMAAGYVVTQEMADYSIVLDYTSETDYKLDMEMDGVKISLICGQTEATLNMDDDEPIISTDVADYCSEMYQEVTSSLTKNVEHEMFYNKKFLVEYETTDDGFEAIGTYDDDTTNSLKINAEATKLEFKDDTWSFVVETK